MDSSFLLATYTGLPFRPDSISQVLRRAAAKVGLPDMRLHDLRHMTITYMLVEGIDPKTVSVMAEHATAQFTLNQYARVLDQTKRKATDALQNKLFSLQAKERNPKEKNRQKTMREPSMER